MISSLTRNSLLDYLTVGSSGGTGDGSSPAPLGTNASLKAGISATAQAALQKAGSTLQATTAGRALDQGQTTLAADLRAAMAASGVKLAGAIEFSVGSDGTTDVKGSDADKAAISAFLKSDPSRPSFATRIATQAQDAMKVSATIQQSAAIAQAARYSGTSSGVMSLYASLMQESNTGAAVFTVSAGSSSLTYPGSLATKA